MSYTTIFIDLDDTLYHSSTGLWNAIRDRMCLYMQERLGLPVDEIPTIRQTYLEKYGTTLRGLQHHYQVDTEEYLSYVHDLPLEEYLRPEPAIRKLLLKLPQKKLIFTNADAAHARRVLAVLNLSDCFQGLIDVRALNFLNKPDNEAYLRALTLAGEPDPTDCLMLDDSPRNLAPAQALGITTVLVTQSMENHSANYTIHHLTELYRILPQLWGGQ